MLWCSSVQMASSGISATAQAEKLLEPWLDRQLLKASPFGSPKPLLQLHVLPKCLWLAVTSQGG